MTQCAATAQFLKLNILLGATGLLLQNASFNENRNVDRNINMLKDNIHRFKTLSFLWSVLLKGVPGNQKSNVQSGCKVTPSSISL